MLLYYITDRSQFPGTERARREQLLEKIAKAASSGVDFIQLRERDLCARDLESLAQAAVKAIQSASRATRLLINSGTDIALAVEADGVHLRSNDISPAEVREIWAEARNSCKPLIAVSCHAEADVIAAKQSGAGFVVFGPVFEKQAGPDVGATGIERLHAACQHGIPVLALGGVSVDNAAACIQAGAAGLAGIRLFQEADIAAIVKKLRAY